MIKVFECHYSFGYFIGTILAIPFFIVLTISFKNIKGDNKNRMNYALKKIILIDLSVILCLLQLLIITLYIYDYKKIYIPYKNGEMNVIEGKITGYTTNTVSEKFCLGDEEFRYRFNTIANLGYHKTKSEGGFIYEDQQYVKIEYIDLGEKTGNVIVGLWIEKKDYVNLKNNVSNQNGSSKVILIMIGSMWLLGIIIFWIYRKMIKK